MAKGGGGYNSLNGIVTIIQNDVAKCIDFRILSKNCSTCTSWEKRQGTLEYEYFISEHNCPINHSGSAGPTEAGGIVECFQSSIQNRKLRYTQLIGDGDSKTHPSILAADTYCGTPVEKLECIGRMGSRLHTLQSNDREKLSDGKGISGRDRLTEKMIKTFMGLHYHRI